MSALPLKADILSVSTSVKCQTLQELLLAAELPRYAQSTTNYFIVIASGF